MSDYKYSYTCASVLEIIWRWDEVFSLIAGKYTPLRPPLPHTHRFLPGRGNSGAYNSEP